jgi:monofunctional biosynthetic peptidoglycan transglycosylase
MGKMAETPLSRDLEPGVPTAPPAEDTRPRSRPWLRAVRWVAGGLALLWVVVTAATWPAVGALAKANPKGTAFIDRYLERQRAAGRKPSVAWRPVPYAAIADDLKQAVIVAEDIDFFSHHGFAVAEVRQALRDAWEDRELPRGASTLSQQLVKNRWLSPSYNPLRKLQEAALTWQLERRLPKRRILELYLNVAELGPGIYGAEAAAERYFGVSAAALSARQAAELAASLPRPSTWHPGVTDRGYLRRVARIEGRMARAAWVRRDL